MEFEQTIIPTDRRSWFPNYRLVEFYTNPNFGDDFYVLMDTDSFLPHPTVALLRFPLSHWERG
jgi:hypothetical protein